MNGQNGKTNRQRKCWQDIFQFKQKKRSRSNISHLFSSHLSTPLSQNARLCILGRTLTRCWSIFFAFPSTSTVGTRRQIINVPIGTNLSTFLSPSPSPYLLRKIPQVESDLKKTTSLQLPLEQALIFQEVSRIKAAAMLFYRDGTNLRIVGNSFVHRFLTRGCSVVLSFWKGIKGHE